MMWSSIANLKENLSKIALDVHEDDDDELEIHNSPYEGDPSVFDRRNSHRFAHSKSVSGSPIVNGIDVVYNPDIETYKAEIKRLQDSEAEIKALSRNYAAILKEKEDHISRLNQENGSLRKNLDATSAALNVPRSESSKASTNSFNVVKASGEQSPNRQLKVVTQMKNRSSGNQMQNGVASKHVGIGNGVLHADQNKMSNLHGNEKELEDLLEEKNRSLEAAQATHELQMKQLRMELEKERDKLVKSQKQLHEEQKLKGMLQDELMLLKEDKEKTSVEMSKVIDQLTEKLSEIKRLKMELRRQNNEDADGVVESLRGIIAMLENENDNLKMEKNELEGALNLSRNSSFDKVPLDVSDPLLNRKGESSGGFPGKEEMEQSVQKLENDLKETRGQRDKALQECARLKQHLLEKENEDSEKMDEDSKIIEELQETVEYQRAQILHLDKALKQAIASQEEVKMSNSHEIEKSREVINDLNQRLANCMNVIDAKNVELFNLQSALGQYYAEIEAKEHLERDLALAKEESAKFSGFLKEADQIAEVLKREKEEILAKFTQAEQLLMEGKKRVNKLEEDNGKLRRALEQSMTRLNRMSVDSDYLVDRRIVIKLLVTYFQRNHSKEVLDLMVRMLGFSDEDKQRIGVAQQGAGKGVVRGVLGLPGRLVGGILGGSSADHANKVSENQSFADMWVDYLLKETEERERRELLEDPGRPTGDLPGRNPTTAGASPTTMHDHRASTTGMFSDFSKSNLSPSQNHSHPPMQGNLLLSEHSDSEFSTVPLTSADSTSRISRLLPKY
ncbi:GRIP-related ARF-binding domain-containing protein 1 isoform 1 [Tripterygium wilfordii]|uniref:GRIP-related ARF-binding domain-containing protein 1 isoform 1 n=1 Tax=Tripterygium wilfordii TaxID=458696 RepID=A0A7J7CGC1_TRIWF|nr:golgin candidate 4 [Tripterygium wilfordii]KAF5733089.1 GRIP-related ARF-binding domain-containing protein 1 isoform 1 [Tripterygium wilfordii]